MLELATLMLLMAQDPEPAFVVNNEASESRSQILRVSMPFPRGRHRQLYRARVDGADAACSTLMRWPDGSVAVSQVHVRVLLKPRERRRFSLEPLRGPCPEPADTPWPLAKLHRALPVWTEVRDPWGQVYRARWQLDEGAGEGGMVQKTPLVRVRQYRGVHVNEADGGRQFLGVLAWLTTFRGERRAELTVALDNARHLPGPVLGPVRLQSFALISDTDDLRLRPRFIRENQLRPPVHRRTGGYRQLLLGPSDQIYLGDRTAKAFVFDLFLADKAATKAERRAAVLAADAPLVALPEMTWTRSTGAFAVHGALAPGSGAPHPQAMVTELRLRLQGNYGPFGGFGDQRDATAQGTPRNGPCSLHNVLRWGSGRLLRVASGMVLQHGLRPPPGLAPRLPKDTAPFRAGLSKRTVRMPHGFTPLDYEHFSVDLLFDYYWLTGDPWARLEIVRMVKELPSLLRGVPFLTCRGEGWCMQAAAQHDMATGDGRVLRFVCDRFKSKVQKQLGPARASYVLRQPPHVDAFGAGVSFDAPWQMAAFVHGLHAVYRRTDQPMFLNALIRTARAMAGPGWVEKTGPKYLVSATDAGRYTMPVGFGPLEGTALMEIGAFVLAEELATEAADKRLFRRRADFIYQPYEKTEPEVTSANPWFQLFLNRRRRDTR